MSGLKEMFINLVLVRKFTNTRCSRYHYPRKGTIVMRDITREVRNFDGTLARNNEYFRIRARPNVSRGSLDSRRVAVVRTTRFCSDATAFGYFKRKESTRKFHHDAHPAAVDDSGQLYIVGYFCPLLAGVQLETVGNSTERDAWLITYISNPLTSYQVHEGKINPNGTRISFVLTPDITNRPLQLLRPDFAPSPPALSFSLVPLLHISPCLSI